MARKEKKPERAGVTHVYEGPEVLSALLAAAGAEVSAEQVAGKFAAAQAQGLERSEVVPALFTEEPRFESPDDARRLYGNLFGLWDRIAAGLGSTDDAPALAEEGGAGPALPLPERGLEQGDRLAPEVVESVWRHLDALPERERRRKEDKFQNVQPDLAAWLDDVPLPAAGGLAARDLAFEAWAMFDQAFGDRVQAVEWKELKALESEPPPAESEQPALAAYAAEQLDLLADEDPDFGEEQRAQVERVIAAVVAALTRAVRAVN